MLAFAITSLAAIATGAGAMIGTDVASVKWIVNLLGWGVGGAFAAGIAHLRLKASALRAIAVAGTVLTLASLAGPDQASVHRWLAVGPLTVNVAALALPAVLSACARLSGADPIALASMIVAAAALAMQPDASQSIAFTIGCLVLLWPFATARPQVIGAALVLASVVAAARPDPLPPVAEVEQIVTLAWQVWPLLACAMMLALAGTVASPVLSRRKDRAAPALMAYMAMIMLAPLYGWFPVPLAGSGISYVLGLWLGVGLLAMPSPNQADLKHPAGI